MHKNARQPTSVRPFFLSADVNYDRLPESFKSAFTAVIEPLYQELVIEAPNALERAGGSAFVFWLTEEVLRQLTAGHGMDLSLSQTEEQRERQEQAVERCCRVGAAKDKALSALIRLRKFANTPRFKSFPLPPE